MPTAPLVAPRNARQSSADANVVVNPYPKHETAVPINPTNNTIFLPAELESATLPHTMAVAAWVPVKQPCKTPACYEMVVSGSPISKLFS